jgi:hypothetical protein
MSRMTSLLLGLRNPSGGPRWLGLAMCALIACTLLFSAWHTWPVIRTAQLPPRPPEADRTDDQRRAEFATTLSKHQAIVDGRSLFFIPPRPRPPRADPIVDTTPREAPKPTRYGGPSMVAMVNGAVLFSDGQRIKVGESGRNVKVVSVAPPWSATLQWEGVEFVVELFQRDSAIVRPASHASDDVVPLTPPPPSTPPASPAEPASRPPTAPPEPAPQPEPEPEPEPDPEPEPEPEPQGEPEPPASPDPQPEPPAPETT